MSYWNDHLRLESNVESFKQSLRDVISDRTQDLTHNFQAIAYGGKLRLALGSAIIESWQLKPQLSKHTRFNSIFLPTNHEN